MVAKNIQNQRNGKTIINTKKSLKITIYLFSNEFCK